MKRILVLLGLAIMAFSASAEIRTITLDETLTNKSETIVVAPDQTIELKSQIALRQVCNGPYGMTPYLVWDIHGLLFTNNIQAWQNIIVTGPASVYLFSANCSGASVASFEIQPSAFPPDKALTLGAFSGNVKVTMEESTDLVNWTAAINGQVHTNAPDARFFRIKMEKNAPPPP